MSDITEASPVEARPTLPGAPVLRRVRRVLIWTAGAAWVYASFTRGGMSACESGSADPGTGSVAAEPVCHTLTLGPSWLVFLAMTVAVLWAISAALNRATAEEGAVRFLDRAAAFVGVSAVVSIVVAHVWFAMLPIEQLGHGTLFFPFPFASVTLTSAPMP